MSEKRGFQESQLCRNSRETLNMEKTTDDYLRTEIENLIKNAYDLLSGVIEATKPSDIRAKSQNAEWWNRHRLHVLLEVAEDTVTKLSRNIIVAPWFLVELKATIEIVKRWKHNPRWKDIEPSLKNKDNFTHTIGKLWIAEHFMRSGHKAEIVPIGEGASPDLRIQAKGGTQDWLYVECYQPNALTGRSKEIQEKTLEKVIERSMAKAKRQFAIKNPGIIAVFAYNQSNTTIQTLMQKITGRVDRTDRPYLAGFLLLHQHVFFERSEETISFTPKLSVNFTSSPSYFGRIYVISEPAKTENASESIPTDVLLGKKIGAFRKKDLAKPSAPLHRKINRTPLSVIEEPEPMSRTVIRSKAEKILPLFKGNGNIDYLCGSCQTVLAEHVWKLSMSNIVILCPSCHSFNEIPKISKLRYPVKGT
jgi:hypothetical protein